MVERIVSGGQEEALDIIPGGTYLEARPARQAYPGVACGIFPSST